MYPSLHDFQPSSSAQQGGPPRWPPPQLSSPQQNGPSSPPAAAPSNQPMLRVHIAEQYRTFPPVMINSALEDIQRTSFSYDFEFERQLIRKHEAALRDTSPSSASLSKTQSRLPAAFKSSCSPFLAHSSRLSRARLPQTVQRPDPLQQHMERFAPMGYTREDVSMALTALGGDDDITNDKVVEVCKNYQELKSMGFGHATIVGALVLHKDDLAAATDACLAGAADSGLGVRS